MNKPTSTVISTGLTFIVTLLLNTLLNFYTSDKGTIGVGRAVDFAGQRVSIVTVENYSAEFLDGIVLEVPNGTQASKLSTSNPIKIEDIQSGSGAKSAMLKLGQLPPRTATQVFVPLPLNAADSPVRVVNHESASLKLRTDNTLESPLRQAIYSALVVAVLYSLFAFGTAYHTRQVTSQLEARSDALMVRLNAAESKIDKMSNLLAKQKILLLARLSDYAKELDFWRNCIKELLASPIDKKQASTELFDLVTRGLKTFGTKVRDRDLDAIVAAAGWIREASSEPSRTPEVKP